MLDEGPMHLNAHRWDRFSRPVRTVLLLLEHARNGFLGVRRRVEELIHEHLGYSIAFCVLFTLMMIYPLMELLWYTTIRAAISLVIVLAVAYVQRNFGAAMDRTLFR